jgi:hypothetical protein
MLPRLASGHFAGLVLSMAVLNGCASNAIPKDALVLTPDTLERRQLQSRRLDGIGEQQLLSASAGVLQDLGFNIDESETKLGVIVASKDRSAYNAGQIAAAVAADIALTLLGSGHMMAYDKSQKIRVSLVTRPALAADGSARPDSQVIRITIQRLVWNSDHVLTHVESVEDPEVYRQFYDRLSKSIFLEAQQL